ncbi:tetratricopeptide repeat protein [Nocardiopsis sp. CNT-189]|uniref:ATP-binding protein n=1 Tax=Nocardiopsis oceanisediminis TaxID=2816862 RepID=UPI003B2BD96E
MTGRREDRAGGTRSEMSGRSQDVVQAGSIGGDVHFHSNRAEQPKGPPPRQLPRGVRGFVNRAAELDRLNAIVTGADGGQHLIDVCVIAGTAGAGKTSLAVRWAHQVQDRFPDGQLYINLRGYDPGEPVTASQALRRFLTALGVEAGSVPEDLDEAAALYRSLLAGRRILVLLDNAASAAQVRPLLPGHSAGLAVVTSRGRLSGLAVHDGAHRITLGTLPEPEAVALLSTITSGLRPADGDAELAELARLCAGLPLALRIAAERAATHPLMGLGELIGELRDESGLWEALDTGEEEETSAVRSVFSWSYRALPPEAARLFRLLGLHPGPDFGIAAAAALAGISTRRARHLLDVLAGAHLLEQTAPDRFEFHDLLRAYAADRAHDDEEPADRSGALQRLLDWYLHAADAAQGRISPAEDRLCLEPPGDGIAPPVFADYDQAVDWAEREHRNLVEAVRAAHEAGLDQCAWQLAAVLWNAQAPSVPPGDWIAAGEAGLASARRLGDGPAQARLLESLGFGHVQLHRLEQGAELHRAALELFTGLGDRSGQATAFNALGLIHLRRRRLAEAEARFSQAIEAFGGLGQDHWRSVARFNLATARHQAGRSAEAEEIIERELEAHRARGDKRSTGNALRILSAIRLDRDEPQSALEAAEEAVEIALGLRSHLAEGYWLLDLGSAQRALGRFGEALASFQRSAVLQRRQRNRSREALAWHGAGETYLLMGRPEQAADLHRRAAGVHRELHDPWNRALALEGLAEALAPDRPDEARAHWEEALRLLAGYGDPRAVRTRERIRARLAAGR